MEQEEEGRCWSVVVQLKPPEGMTSCVDQRGAGLSGVVGWEIEHSLHEVSKRECTKAWTSAKRKCTKRLQAVEPGFNARQGQLETCLQRRIFAAR